MELNVAKDRIMEYCEKYQVRRLALFGSVLRDDFGPESDVDVLVEFEPGTTVGFFKFMEMQNELSDLLGREVDLNTAGFLSRHFRDDVIEMAEAIYERC